VRVHFFRLGGLLMALIVVAVGVVHLRQEQARLARDVLQLEVEWMQHRRTLWGVQTQIARLRAPAELRERYQLFLPEQVYVGRSENSGIVGWPRIE